MLQQHPSRKISVIIPSGSNSQPIFSPLQSLVTELSATGFDFEIIIFGDDCQNFLQQTIENKIINGNSDKIKIFNLSSNTASTNFLKESLSKAQGDVIAFIDADLDLPALNLRTMLAYMDQEKADIALSSKNHSQSQFVYPIIPKVFTYLYQLLIKFLFNLEACDHHIKVKVFKREILKEILPRLKLYTDLELLIVAKDCGFKKITTGPVISNLNFKNRLSFVSIKNILLEISTIFYLKAFLRSYQEPLLGIRLIKI